jgi:hypothetical protein
LERRQLKIFQVDAIPVFPETSAIPGREKLIHGSVDADIADDVKIPAPVIKFLTFLIMFPL